MSGLKVNMVKVTGAQNEQTQVEVHVPASVVSQGGVAVFQFLAPAYMALDLRLREVNGRIADAMRYEQSLDPTIKGHVALGVRRTLDFLAGIQTAPPMEAVEADRANVEAEKQRILLEEGVDVDAPPVQGGKVIPLHSHEDGDGNE